MEIRRVTVLALLIVLLLVAACGSEPSNTTLEYTGYLTSEIPPCSPVEGSSVDPCDPDAGQVGGGEASYELGSEPTGMGEHLNSTPVHVAHLVVRGTYLPGTVRCTSDVHLFRPPAYSYTDLDEWEFVQWLKSVKCYTDVRVNEYILGSGPPTLTILMLKLPYRGYMEMDEIEESRIAMERAIIEGGYHNHVMIPEGGMLGREMALFLGPSIDVQAQSWRVMTWWEIERREDDGKVVAVHPERDRWRHTSPDDYQTYRSTLEMELPAFRQSVTAAHQARLTAHGGRTGPDEDFPMLETDANRLTEFFRAVGAYDHPDGPPVQPPPPCGLVVTDQVDNPDYMGDCQALLVAKDTLRGTGTLNWSTGAAISSWDGVTTAGTPTRVTKVLLASKSLTGVIPAEIGDLSELTNLDLSGNSLTGEIPPEIGRLDNLVEVRLSGNSLTGCIPHGLKDVATNDLSALNLLYCPPAPEDLRGGEPGVSSLPLTWTPVADTTKYRVEYLRKNWYDTSWTVDDESITTTSHTVDGLVCEREYFFRVSAFGNGTTYPAAWSDHSEVLTRRTSGCTPPVFAETSYSFTITEDAALRTLLGSISATDDNGGPVRYDIKSWFGLNAPDYFELDENTGAFTVTADLSGRAGDSVRITVSAFDETGGEGTVDVNVDVLKGCFSGTAVSNPSDNPSLVSDCKVLLDLQDELAGTATLNWSVDTAMSSWDGVTLGGTPSRVTGLNLRGSGLTGVLPAEMGLLGGLESLRLGYNDLRGPIPSELGDLAELRTLHLQINRLSGPIPSELGKLSNLTGLWLHDNGLMGEIPLELSDLSELDGLGLGGNNLSGAIPPELGLLTRLTDLSLDGNRLSGAIPPELGLLTRLTDLWLDENRLSGAIPWELGIPPQLSTLYLSDNVFEGCIRPSLRLVRVNDIDELGLSDCTESGRVPTPTGVSATLADGAFTITWSAVSDAASYQVQHRVMDSGEEWAGLPAATGTSTTYTPDGGPACGTTYEFRVRSYGDASTYAAGWSEGSAVATVTTDACNLPPEFDEESYAFSVAEDAEVDDTVGTVSATDQDEDDDVSYAITAGNTANTFAIDDETGAVTVNAALDHETEEEYILTVEVDDGNGQTDTVTVTITVMDVAEAPVLDETSYAFSVAEDAEVDHAVGTVSAADQDEDDVVSYAITAGNTGNAFAIDDETGAITVNAALDHETTDEYTLMVEAEDSTGGEATVTVTVTVTDVAESPEFDEESYAFSVAEDAEVDHAVGTVSATDQDEGDVVSYAITAGNTGNAFAIDDGTGAITVNAALDHETTDEYTLMVEAEDSAGGEATVTVTVTVTDVAEDAPPAPGNLSATLSSGTFTLTWDAVAGAAKYEAQHTTDAATVTWTALAETTGITQDYTPSSGAACGTEYRFRVRAYGDGTVYVADWGSDSTVASVTSRPCDNAPAFGESNYAFTIAEDAAITSSVRNRRGHGPGRGRHGFLLDHRRQ